MANTAAAVLEDLLNHLQPVPAPSGAAPALPLLPARYELGAGAIAATLAADASMIGRPILVVRTAPAGPVQTVAFTRAGVAKVATLSGPGDAVMLVGVDASSYGVLMSPEGGIA